MKQQISLLDLKTRFHSLFSPLEFLHITLYPPPFKYSTITVYSKLSYTPCYTNYGLLSRNSNGITKQNFLKKWKN